MRPFSLRRGGGASPWIPDLHFYTEDVIHSTWYCNIIGQMYQQPLFVRQCLHHISIALLFTHPPAVGWWRHSKRRSPTRHASTPLPINKEFAPFPGDHIAATRVICTSAVEFPFFVGDQHPTPRERKAPVADVRNVFQTYCAYNLCFRDVVPANMYGFPNALETTRTLTSE